MPTNSTIPDPQLNTDELVSEEDYSSGNGRLAIIVGILLLLAIVGYVFVPGTGSRRVISSVMPSVMLGEANVTGSRIVDKPAATQPAEEAEKSTAAETKKSVTRPAAEEALAARTPVAVTATPAVQPETSTAPAAAPAEVPATLTLTGRILDENGRPLAGATVLVKGSRRGTGTDANGNYSLEVPAGENALVYGYGGYQDQEVHTRGSQPVNVTLLPNEGGRRRR